MFMDSMITYRFSSTEDSSLYTKTQILRNTAGDEKQRTQYEWDAERDRWTGLSRVDIFHDPPGKVIREEILQKDGSTSSWVDHMKQVYTYDLNGQKLQDLGYQWQPEQRSWRERMRHEHRYDDEGRLTEVLGAVWELEHQDWSSAGKYQIHHDPEEGLAEAVYLFRAPVSGEWQPFFRNEDSYDSSDRLLSRTVHYWDTDRDEWYASHKLEHKYDVFGRRISEKHSDREPETGEWVLSYACEWLADPMGRINSEAHYSWNRELSEWEVLYRSHYHYDERMRMESGSVCSGDSLLWRGRYYHSEGIYYDSCYVLGLQVFPGPRTFQIAGPDQVEEDQVLIYTTPDEPGLSYSWLAENGAPLSQPTENSVEVQWDHPGEGRIIAFAKDVHGCKSSPSIMQVTVVSALVHAPDLSASGTPDLQLYPNPAGERVYVRVQATGQVHRLRFLDATGMLILEKEVDASIQEISTADWPGGLYVLQLLSSGKQVLDIKKLIIR